MMILSLATKITSAVNVKDFVNTLDANYGKFEHRGYLIFLTWKAANFIVYTRVGKSIFGMLVSYYFAH